MPKVRMRSKLTGTRDGLDWPDVGGVIDVSDDEAAVLIHHGMAEPPGRHADEGETEAAAVDTSPRKRTA